MPASVILRSQKGSALSFQEMDGNFQTLANYGYSKTEIDQQNAALSKSILESVFSATPGGYQPIANLYFGPNGDDSNTGLGREPSTQLKTLQMAFQRLSAILFPVAPFGIVSDPGVYGGASLYRSVPTYISITGDPALPSNHKFIGTVSQPAIEVENINVEINGICLQGNYMLRAGHGSRILLKNCIFDGPFDFGLVADGGKIFIQDSCIFRDNLSSGVGIYSKRQGYIGIENALALLGVCEIETFALCEHNSLLQLSNVINGSNTGTRFRVRCNSLISTSGRGPNSFPGTVAGIIDSATGGIYE